MVATATYFLSLGWMFPIFEVRLRRRSEESVTFEQDVLLAETEPSVFLSCRWAQTRLTRGAGARKANNGIKSEPENGALVGLRIVWSLLWTGIDITKIC
jgi:hypothetical protein